MNDTQMNKFLVSSLPDLKDIYVYESNLIDGDRTGSHIIYGLVLAKALEKALVTHNMEKCRKYCHFIEEALATKDKELINVIVISVLESLYYSNIDRETTQSFLGILALKYWNDLIDRSQRIDAKNREFASISA